MNVQSFSDIQKKTHTLYMYVYIYIYVYICIYMYKHTLYQHSQHYQHLNYNVFFQKSPFSNRFFDLFQATKNAPRRPHLLLAPAGWLVPVDPHLPGKTMGKLWEHGGLMGFYGILPPGNLLHIYGKYGRL